jgi:hypothetical protein
VLRVPTAEGDLYFKAVSAVHRYEAALTGLLADLQPSRVAEVVAVDAERGWMLMRDGGTRLRELVETRADLHHWERLLPGYAQLQIEMTPKVKCLIDLGVPDERLTVLPDHFRELLATRPKGLTADEHQRLIGAAPGFDDMCRELAAHGIPATIQHDDLHDGQVFVGEGGYRVFDWGDSCVSHPFHSLTVILRMIAWQRDLKPGGRELQRIRDAYLEPFGRHLEPVAFQCAQWPQALPSGRPDWNVASRLAMKRAAMPEITLTPLTERDCDEFFQEQIADYADQQVRDAGWSRHSSLDRARAEFTPVLEREYAEAVERDHWLWSAKASEGQARQHRKRASASPLCSSGLRGARTERHQDLPSQAVVRVAQRWTRRV